VTPPVRVRRRAELDVDEAYAWYEARAEGLGEAFLRAVEACFARMVRHPEAHARGADRAYWKSRGIVSSQLFSLTSAPFSNRRRVMSR